MKRFVTYITIFLLPIIILSIWAEVLLRNIPNDYAYKSNYLEKHASSIQVLFLGSSHAFYGINPTFISFKSFNASYISQSLNYDFEIIKKYDQQWDSLKYIVIPLDYFTIYRTLELSVEAWRVKDYVIYYNFSIPHSLNQNAEILSNNFKINWLRIRSYYFDKSTNITCSKSGWGVDYNSKDQKDLFITGKAAALRHTADNTICVAKNIAILKEIIQYAKGKNIKVMLITSPAYKSYVENLNSTQLMRTLNLASELEQKNNNTFYFNFLEDTSFKATDFYDADHLNELGAEKFTKKLDSCIEILNLHSNIK